MLHIDKFAQVLSGRPVSGVPGALRAVSAAAEADAADAGSAGGAQASGSRASGSAVLEPKAKAKVPCACESAHSSYLEVVCS